ncbi:hypothetical protein BH23PSE1_BH23PSE1_02600 [soil metagenome]
MENVDAGLWSIAIGAALVVTVVVAVLLALIVRTAADIEAAVAEIWIRGQRVASNTIHIPALYRVGERVGEVLTRARRILMHARAIAEHAEGRRDGDATEEGRR